MKLRVIVSVLIPAALLALPAYASFGGHKDEDSSSPPQTQNSAPAPTLTAHQQAEAWYATAYEVVNKAKAEQAKGKEKNAMKKFKDAYSRGEQIVEADSMYHEAWNLMGYSARKLGWYDKAFAAYDHCLRIKPDYAPAREYLGEAYLEMKQPDKAHEQLAKLESLGATDDANTLRAAIDAYEKANPAAAGASSSN